MNDVMELLREHDPARDKALTRADRTRILQRALARTPRTRWRLAAAFALVALVLVAGAVVRGRRVEPLPRRAAVRQVQYATPGGTRIIWTLDPDFHM